MKKKLISITILSMFLLIHSHVLAVEISLNTDYTEDYKRYLEASDEEKEKYTIVPNQYNYRGSNEVITNPVTMMNLLGASNEPYYSLRDTIPNNIIIKDQKNLTLCWCFAMLSGLATNLGLKNPNNTYDFSARHMDYAAVKDTLEGANKNPYGLNRNPGSIATWGIAVNYLTNGLGAVNETSMPLNYNTSLVSLNDITGKNSVTETYDVLIYPEPTTQSEKVNLVNEVKKNIKLYGAVPAQICGEDLNNNPYYNESKYALYYPESANAPIDHAVSIIGWNDNFDVSNFNSNYAPPGNGAWIVQNSWGTDLGDNGIIYISYYDKNISKGLIQITNAVDKSDASYTKKFDNRYIHDKQGFGPSLTFEGSNKIFLGSKFTAEKSSEYLSMISIANLNSSDCKVYVNPHGSSINKSELTPVKLKSGDYTTTLGSGYSSLELQTPIKIDSSNKEFAVVVELTSNVTQSVNSFFIETNGTNSIYSNVDISGKCFATDEQGFNDNDWVNLSNIENPADTTLRAYTLDSVASQKVLTGIAIDHEPNKKTYNVGDTFENDGLIVKALYSDNTSEVVSDYVITDGYILKSGQTYVTVEYNNFYAHQSITVNSTVTPDNPVVNSIPEESVNNTVPDVPANNTVPDVPANNTVPDVPVNNTVPDSPGVNPEPNNLNEDISQEPQNSSLTGLKPSIKTFKSDGTMVVHIDNFNQNTMNDKMQYSIYLSAKNSEDITSKQFSNLKDYTISGNSIEFEIDKNMISEFFDLQQLDSADKIFLYLKETALLGSNAKTAYSNAMELIIDENESVIPDYTKEENLEQNEKYSSLKDDTVAKDPIPQTGVKPILFIIALFGVISIILIVKYKLIIK